MVEDARDGTKLHVAETQHMFCKQQNMQNRLAYLFIFALLFVSLSFATPTYSGAGTLVYTTGANVVVTPPAHAVNNILLLNIEVKNTTADTISFIAGNTNWVLLTSVSTATQTWYWYYDRCTSSAEGTTTINQSTGFILGAKIYNFNGSIATINSPFQVIGVPSTAGAVALLPLNSITTFANNSLIIAAAMDGNTNPASCTVVGVSPTSYTTVYSELTAIGTCLGYATQTASATTGQVNLTWSTATTGNSAGVVLSLISPITFNVTLLSPPNASWDNVGLFKFNASGSETSYNCSLYMNNVLNNTKSCLNATACNFTYLEHGYYDWNVSCNVWNVTNASATWNINLDFESPITTASTTIANGSTYAFGTYMLTANTTTTLTCDDGIGEGHAGCNQTLYCIDTTNACTPNLIYSTLLIISAPNTSYIRYASNDKYMIPPNLETTKSGYVALVGGEGGTITNIYGADPLLCSYPGFVPAAAATALITCRPIDNSTGLPITGATINCQAWNTAIDTIKQASSTMIERAGRYYTWALTMNNVPNNDCVWINCTTTMNGLLVGYAGTVCREAIELFTIVEQEQLLNASNTSLIWSYSGRNASASNLPDNYLNATQQEQLANISGETNYYLDNATLNLTYDTTAIMSQVNESLASTSANQLAQQEQISTDTIFYAAYVLICIVMGIIALMYDRTMLYMLSGALFVGLGILLMNMSIIVMICCIGIGFYLWARIFVQ